MDPGEDPTEGTAATKVETPRRRDVPAAPRSPLPSVRLGHFQLLEQLGKGGMGTVWSAYDLHLDRKVAIKLLSRRSSDPERAQQRMLREAQAMAKLSHPNVVSAYEVGVADDGTVFIAMEYVAGDTLGGWRKGKSWREIVRVFVQAGRGLAAAHEANIVHRDFKPANVLVDARGHVRVADFGIAQVRGMAMEDESARVPRVELREVDELSPPTPDTPLTELGSRMGTPAYMSPEQFERTTVDARSDQFSFCIALYEALFDRRPFEGDGKALADNVRAGAVLPPDPKAGVPGWVTAIVLRGLATDPDKRFPSMADLVAVLERDPSRRRKQLGFGALGVVTVAAIALVIGARIGGRDEAVCAGAAEQLKDAWNPTLHDAIGKSFDATKVPYARSSTAAVTAALDRYATRWTAMRTEACRATRVTGEQSEHLLDLRIACLDRKRAELATLTTMLAGTVDAKTVEKAAYAAAALSPVAACADTTALLRGTTTAGDPALLAELHRLRATRRLGKANTALAPARALVDAARKSHDIRVLAESLELQGVLEADSGDLARSEVSLTEALRWARQLDDVDLLATTTIDLVSTLADGGISQAREALGVLRVVEPMVADVHDPAIPIRYLLEKGDEYLVLARPEAATPIFAQAIEQGKRTLGDDHVLVFRLRALYGSALAHEGKRADALADYDALIAGATRTLGAQHPVTVNARLQRCGVYADTNSPAKSVECFGPVLPDARAVYQRGDRELLSFRESYATSLAQLGKKPEARKELEELIAEIPDDAWKEKWFVAVDAAHVLGTLELEAGDAKSALAHCQRSAAAMEAEHASPANATCIGEAHLALGDPAAALAALEPLRDPIAKATDPLNQLGATRAMIGMWRFAYARAAWLVRHSAAEARAHGVKSREELGDSPQRAELDAWLATVK